MEVKPVTADEGFIDMEVSSFSTFFYHCASSPRHSKEFEFQREREPTTSPADELFYKGKLLPLHLLPRLQMIEKLPRNSTSVYHDPKDVNLDEFYPIPSSTTPLQSCNLDELSGLFGENLDKTWTARKLRLIKQSSFGSKLKASRDYLKAFFGKSCCSNESRVAATKVADEGSISKIQKNQKSVKKLTEGRTGLHRRSFSFAFRRSSTNKISSSSSSSSSSACSSSSSSMNSVQLLRRSGSVNAEAENSIQGAIAHCKRSQQPICWRDCE